MRKTLLSLIAACAMGVVASASLAAETTLRITLQLPIKSHLGQNLMLFKETVEKNSNGEIEVQIYDSAQLYKDKQVPQAVGSGAIEMGVASLTRFVGDVPAVDIFYQPFMFNSDQLVRAATAKGSAVRDPLDEAILQQTGARVLWWQAYGSAVMLTNDAPLSTPADMANKKVRVFGKTLGEFVEACGGAPTLISGSEQYLAYQRGTVDVGMTGVSGVKSRKLWDVMDTITKTQHADIEFIVVVNEDFWNGLPAAHREIITAAADLADKAVRDEILEIEADAYAEASKNGMSIIEPTAEQIAAWQDCSTAVYQAYEQTAGELGQTVMEAARALRAGG